MKRVFWMLLPLLSLILGSCATPQKSEDLVNRALDAMGGADSFLKVKTITVRGASRQWEPEQSHSPGGEMRFANNSTFETVADLGARNARTTWVKNFEYPAPRTFKFMEIVTPAAGWVIGREANGLNKQASEQKSPQHSMSGVRLATNQRELMRLSAPLLLLDMKRNPDRVRSISDTSAGYRVGPHDFIVMFDPSSGLPSRIRTLDYDNVWGDVNFDLVLSDWRDMGGLRLPATQKYELNGRVVQDIRLTEVIPNPTVSASTFEPPAEIRAGAAQPASGTIPYQWVLRRQFIGTYMDSDNVAFDAKGSPGLRLNEVAAGVQHQVGGTHHSLIVELRDYLVVVDAPVTDYQSNWTIAAAKAKYPGKPIRYLVMTHHHMDHAGGIRSFVADGATLVVGRGAADHYRKVLAAPFTRNPDLPSRSLAGAQVIEVGDKHVFNDGKREMSVHLLDNPHATSTLLAYVADARVAYVTDVWSPGTPLPPKMNAALASIVNGVKKAGIQPVTFVGGHGSSAPYSSLTALPQ